MSLLAPFALLAVLSPQDGVPSTVAFRQACLDATSDALVMNVAAHPDDEAARTMVYLRNKFGVRTVTVYSTCGEGGQNAIGREIGRALAAIRVAETRAAAARYGTEIRWLGFPDFGYSKSLDETLAVWGRDRTLARMQEALDEIGPDVVLTNHSIDGGHGHHRASYLAIFEACKARSARLGGPTALYRRGSARRGEEESSDVLFAFDPGELDPVRGLTFARQAHEAWTLHRSQGPWGPHDPTRVRVDRWLQAVPEAADQDGPEAPLSRLGSMFDCAEVLAAVDDVDALRGELAAFAEDRPVRAHVESARQLLPRLRVLRDRMPAASVPARARIDRRIEALERVVVHGTGVAIETWLPDDTVPLGESVEVRVALRGSVRFEEPKITCGGVAAEPTPGDTDGRWWTVRLAVPGSALDDPIIALTRTVVFPLRAAIRIDGLDVVIRRDVVVRLAPDRDLAWDRAHAYVPGGSAWTRVFSLEVAHHGRGAFDEALRFRAPDGVRVEAIPPRVRMADGQRTARVLARVSWTPGGGGDGEGERAEAIEVLATLGSVRSRLVLQPVALPAALPPPRVALVRGPDDTVERTLGDLGLEVAVLDETGLATAELRAFDTLVLDIRAYHHRPDLANHRERILAFCRAGGRVVAFYHKEREWNEAPGKPLLAPFSLVVGRDRVSEEDAPIERLEPAHPIWTRPFAIGPDDFEAWVQERGLNFPREWDPAWVPLLSSHDRGEEPLRGGLLYARYGRGDYVYCSLALYRQLRIGHPGAVRILLNLLWR